MHLGFTENYSEQYSANQMFVNVRSITTSTAHNKIAVLNSTGTSLAHTSVIPSAAKTTTDGRGQTTHFNLPWT